LHWAWPTLDQPFSVWHQQETVPAVSGSDGSLEVIIRNPRYKKDLLEKDSVDLVVVGHVSRLDSLGLDRIDPLLSLRVEGGGCCLCVLVFVSCVFSMHPLCRGASIITGGWLAPDLRWALKGIAKSRRPWPATAGSLQGATTRDPNSGPSSHPTPSRLSRPAWARNISSHQFIITHE
jgi:hypothetical protein